MIQIKLGKNSNNWASLFNMKAALARHYIEILSIGKDSLDAKKLLNYKAPTHASKVQYIKDYYYKL